MFEVEGFFGENIKKNRIDMGLTIEVLAEKSGLAVARIGGIENGTIFPNTNDLMKIGRALGKHDGFLFTNAIFTKKGGV